MHKIHLTATQPEADYDIIIGAHLCDRVAVFIADQYNPRLCAVVTDSNVAPLHLSKLETALENVGIQALACVVSAGEEHKNIQTVSNIWDYVLQHRWERRLPIIALGGGVVGDMAGFAAATVLRGVPLIQMPTSLLAAVDASVGGKTGIDHTMGKNLLGAFHHASLVAADVNLISTIPRCELQSGLAECIKHAVIADEGVFHWLEENLPQILALHPSALTELIHQNVRIKAHIVSQDPYEKSIRAHLNLGHTFGHALEKVVGYDKLSHGYAVALGMLAATRLAMELGRCDPQLLPRLEQLIQQAGLPTTMKKHDPQAILSAMYSDKKVAGARLRLILPVKTGQVAIVTDVPDAAILEAIATLMTAGAPSA